MSPTFLVFFSMLAAFLLLTLAAVVRRVWHLFHRPEQSAAIGVANQQAPALTDGLLLVGVAISW